MASQAIPLSDSESLWVPFRVEEHAAQPARRERDAGRPDWVRGTLRQVNVSKDGFMFAAASHLPRLLAAFEADDLARSTPCQGMNQDALVAALARTHAELVLIHPFREGGRCARLLGWLMALQAGWPPLDFSPLSGRGKAAYFMAIQSALARDYAPLEHCFNRVLARTLRASAARA
jgi:cell filamentation protein